MSSQIQSINQIEKSAYPILPLGSVKPEGWLKKVLVEQAKGITGILDEQWPDIAESAWIGGNKEGWERAPYWLDGLVPLAYLLEDPQLIKKVHTWMDYILSHQTEDGWLGPIKDQAYGEKYQAYDPWPVFIFLKAALQFFDATRDSHIISACLKFFKNLQTLLSQKPLFEWSRSRWAECLLSIYKVYALTDEKWLLELASTLKEQGYDWRQHFENFQYPEKITHTFGQETHVVNNAMALKQPALWYQVSRNQGDYHAIKNMLAVLDQFHGQITGVFSGDEHYAGLNPSQGTELCAVVEYMYSLEILLEILGDVSLADRLERIAYNALPATLSSDLRLHQYDQQVNQVQCKRSQDKIWVNNGQDANLFGLEPNFGCCTANLHQGWPKFAAQIWRRSPDHGLAVFTYAPCCLETLVQGVPLSVRMITQYPFRDLIEIELVAKADLSFPLYLRIPGWCEQAEIKGHAIHQTTTESGTLAAIRINLEAEKSLRISVKFATKLELPRRFHNSVGIIKGPLVYALKIEEKWSKLENPTELWEVTPISPWNYGLSTPEQIRDEISFFEKPLAEGEQLFSPEHYPIFARVSGQKVADWQLERNAAGTIPENPKREENTKPETLTLIPYGCTHLRVTEFPCFGK